jgi:NAD(P)-dependent dehydrogenase (short-subunit alcohol dehydrogenase family)
MDRITNVVLTGACGGIGRELAAAFLAGGASVALVGRDEAVLAELVALAPDRARSYTPDVSDSAAMNSVADDWTGSFGTPDVVVANAGVASGFDTADADDLAVMKRMLEINLLGVATTFQPFIDGMRKQRRGTLVGIASIAGWRGMPGNGAYAASKGGLIRYLQSLRAELRPFGVTVTTISPGYVKTPLIAGNTMHMPGMILPEEAARRIIATIRAGREKATVPKRTGIISRAIGILPDPILDRILLREPRKPRAGEPGSTEIPGLQRR